MGLHSTMGITMDIVVILLLFHHCKQTNVDTGEVVVNTHFIKDLRNLTSVVYAMGPGSAQQVMQRHGGRLAAKPFYGHWFVQAFTIKCFDQINRPASIGNGEAHANMGGLLQFVEHGNSIVGSRNPALSLCVLQELICSQAENPCFISGKNFSGRGEHGPV